MKVEAERTKMFRLVAHNKDTSMGQYYAEDDWDITVFGRTLEELKTAAAIAFGRSDIRIDYITIAEVDALLFEGHVFVVSEGRYFNIEEVNLFQTGVLSSKEYAEGMEQRRQQRRQQLKEDAFSYLRRSRSTGKTG